MWTVTEDDFRRLTIPAQALWLHLAAEASAEGIVENAREVRLRLGADDDTVRELMNGGFVTVTAAGAVQTVYPEDRRPAFITKENGITYAKMTLFVPGYGYLQNRAPFEVPIIW